MICEGQKNIKVHLATTEQKIKAISSIAGNCKYNLGTAYPLITQLYNNNNISDSNKGILKKMDEKSNHYILDSGLFTLMFGAKKGLKDNPFPEENA